MVQLTGDDRIGDQVLLTLIAAGDPTAEETLLSRHRAAVERLPAGRTTSAADSAWLAIRWRPRSGEPALPFRAVWLSLHAHGLVPTSVPVEHRALWDAYLALTPSRRLAVWHREVEGERSIEIARHLGVSETEAFTLTRTAYDDLRRHVAIGSVTSCADAQTIIDRYRLSVLSGVPGPAATELQLLARHCPECDRLAASLLAVQDGLRVALAETVLGPLAHDYLRRRFRRPALLAPRAGEAPSAGLRPVLAGLTAAAVAAVVTVAALPGALAPFGADRDVPGAAAPVPGVVLRPDRTDRPNRKALPDRERAGVRRAGGPGASTAKPSTPTTTGGGTPTSTPGAGGTTPVDPPLPVETPAPSPQPRPSDGGPVTVSITSDSATVTVDPAPAPVDPVVVQVPLKPGTP